MGENRTDKTATLEEIMETLREKETDGAYRCSYQGFLMTCRVLARKWERDGKATCILSCTLDRKPCAGMERFFDFIRRHLRQSDAYAPYGTRQVLILLPDTDKRGAEIVVQKLKRAWEEEEGPGGAAIHFQVCPLDSLGERN